MYMTPAAGASAPKDSARCARRAPRSYARPRHDLALVVAVLGALLAASWLRSPSAGDIALELSELPEARIDVQSADWYEWTLLEGIGEARARWIVRHREEHGPFRSLEDLRAIPRLPAGWVEAAAPFLELPAESPAEVPEIPEIPEVPAEVSGRGR